MSMNNSQQRTLDSRSVLAEIRRAVFRSEPAEHIVIHGTTDEYGVSGEFTLEQGASGKFRRRVFGPLSSSSGFDGTESWDTDHMGVERTLHLAERDHVRMETWFRDHTWLQDPDLLTVEIDESLSSEREVALRVQVRDSHERAILCVERQRWRPVRMMLNPMSGTTTIELADYREVFGRFLPHAITRRTGTGSVITERITSVEQRETAPAAFSPTGALPDDFHFTDSGGELDIRRSDSGHVLVSVVVDGQGPWWFILDTGAGGTGIDPRIAGVLNPEKLGTISVASIFGVTPSPILRYGSIKIGPIRIDRPIVMQMDFEALEPLLGHPVHGVIGYDLLARCVAEISLRDDIVRVSDSRCYAVARSWQPLVTSNRLPLIPARLDGHPEEYYRIDIGASGGAFSNVAFHSPCVRAKGLVPSSGTTTIDAPPHRFAVGTIRRFDIAGHTFSDAAAVFSLTSVVPFNEECVQGNIGVEFLKPLLITLDYPRKRLAVESLKGTFCFSEK